MHFLKQLSENKLHTAIVKKVIDVPAYFLKLQYRSSADFKVFREKCICFRFR